MGWGGGKGERNEPRVSRRQDLGRWVRAGQREKEKADEKEVVREKETEVKSGSE